MDLDQPRRLVSMPDLKTAPARLTLGKLYLPRRRIGNALVILADDGKDEMLLLEARLASAPPRLGTWLGAQPSGLKEHDKWHS